jgi:hypothetical protein
LLLPTLLYILIFVPQVWGTKMSVKNMSESEMKILVREIAKIFIVMLLCSVLPIAFILSSSWQAQTVQASTNDPLPNYDHLLDPNAQPDFRGGDKNVFLLPNGQVLGVSQPGSALTLSGMLAESQALKDLSSIGVPTMPMEVGTYRGSPAFVAPYLPNHIFAPQFDSEWNGLTLRGYNSDALSRLDLGDLIGARNSLRDSRAKIDQAGWALTDLQYFICGGQAVINDPVYFTKSPTPDNLDEHDYDFTGHDQKLRRAIGLNRMRGLGPGAGVLRNPSIPPNSTPARVPGTGLANALTDIGDAVINAGELSSAAQNMPPEALVCVDPNNLLSPDVQRHCQQLRNSKR